MPETPEIPPEARPISGPCPASPAHAVRRWPAGTGLAVMVLPNWQGAPGPWTLLVPAPPSAWQRGGLEEVIGGLPEMPTLGDRAGPTEDRTVDSNQAAHRTTGVPPVSRRSRDMISTVGSSHRDRRDACRTDDRSLSNHQPQSKSDPTPLGWLLALDYEAGFEVEPTARRHARRGAPTVAAMPFHAGALHHAPSDRWFALGDFDARALFGPSALRAGAPIPRDNAHPSISSSAPARERYERAVARCVELIRAGDLFQANLAHALERAFNGSARALFAELLDHSPDAPPPPHAAYLELPHKTVVSASPELFLDADFGTGVVRTRPIKGTRRAELAHQLETSEKDRAELVMITDLMRNDLGRVCRSGSVRVDSPRDLEQHGPIVHTSATVSGVMRAGVTPLDLLRATFPAGSITGAPKVRAMQVIDEIESPDMPERGSYCGSIGVLTARGRLTLSVAIRTATIADGRLLYPVGAGIVEGSDPALEWHETLHKAEQFMRVLERSSAPAASVASVAPMSVAKPRGTPRPRRGAPA